MTTTIEKKRTFIIGEVFTNYLRNNITINTVILEHTKIINLIQESKIVYVYNYKGEHYRVFDNVIELHKFLNNEECKILFDSVSEDEIYDNLSTLPLT